MLVDSEEISFKALSPVSIRRWVLYPRESHTTRVFFAVYGVFAEYGSITGKQVGYGICHPSPPYRMWVQL
jgi:hypothetical protein